MSSAIHSLMPFLLPTYLVVIKIRSLDVGVSFREWAGAHSRELSATCTEKLHRHESNSWLDYIYSPWSKGGKGGEKVEVHTQQMGEELGSLCAGSTATRIPHTEILHNAEQSRPLSVSWSHLTVPAPWSWRLASIGCATGILSSNNHCKYRVQ